MEELAHDISRLEKLLGVKLFAVGGCVRNILLQCAIKDYDFTTSSTPDEIETAVRNAGKKAYTIGKKYGTIGMKDERLGTIEITTFRSEVYVEGSRKPLVTYVEDLYADLSRRDFTMNAIALDADGVIHDPFDGRNSLTTGCISCVGDSNSRLLEDPLRMLRAIRFALQFSFTLDSQLHAAIKKNAFSILSIAKERITAEIDKMFSYDKLFTLVLLEKTGILGYLFPESSLSQPFVTTECTKWIPTTGSTEEKGWFLLFKCLCQIWSTEETGICSKDTIEKYSAHYKFSNSRKAFLLKNFDCK